MKQEGEFMLRGAYVENNGKNGLGLLILYSFEMFHNVIYYY
jgi:hypothetical protein